mmetsp:Transcript_42509/g.91297  ORF Transcript_42509/g.91297 Transcript_42509/m.91297 type:complete len:292 (+) Transcript_42509:354-1229(+)
MIEGLLRFPVLEATENTMSLLSRHVWELAEEPEYAVRPENLVHDAAGEDVHLRMGAASQEGDHAISHELHVAQGQSADHVVADDDVQALIEVKLGHLGGEQRRGAVANAFNLGVVNAQLRLQVGRHGAAQTVPGGHDLEARAVGQHVLHERLLEVRVSVQELLDVQGCVAAPATVEKTARGLHDGEVFRPFADDLELLEDATVLQLFLDEGSSLPHAKMDILDFIGIPCDLRLANVCNSGDHVGESITKRPSAANGDADGLLRHIDDDTEHRFVDPSLDGVHNDLAVMARE